MSNIKSFEDIQSWKKARALNKLIYSVTLVNIEFNKDYGLKDQIRRSSISITSNIAEGFDRETNKEFKRFLYIAKGSAAELKSQLYLAFDLGYLKSNEFDILLKEVNEISKLLYGLIKYLNENL